VRDRGIGVAHSRRDFERVGTLLDQQARVGVAQIVRVSRVPVRSAARTRTLTGRLQAGNKIDTAPEYLSVERNSDSDREIRELA
jgi:hypothetical protein